MEVLLPLLLTLPPAAGAMIAMAISFGIMMVAVFFVLAYALQNQQMVAMAREELAALLFSVFIILFWVGSDAFFNSIASGMLASTLPSHFQGQASSNSLGGLTNSHLNLALATLDILEQKLRAQYIDLYLFEALIGFLSTISFPLGSPIPAVNLISFSIAPFTGLVMLSNAHTVIVEAIGYLVTVLWGKEFLLIFSRDVVPILLFPLGLVLRSFPFFRMTGSTIIAICFAMYFVFPFAIILSNYLIFDVFKPADFTYTPSTASYMGTEHSQSHYQAQTEEAEEGSAVDHLFEQFSAPSLAEEASDDASDECVGNVIVRMLCSAGNIIWRGLSAVGGFISTVWNIWRFMMGMTGDFFYTAFNNPLMPASASAGLFHFLILEVTTISPFIILVMLSTLMEIIITITAFRSVSLLIGGEAEIIGISKVV